MGLNPESFNADAQQAKDAAVNAVRAGSKAINDTTKGIKTTANVAKNAAAGNVAGVVFEILKNPKALIWAATVAFIFIVLPIVFVGTFVIALPGSIIESVQAAGSSTTQNVGEGWEMWKAQLGNRFSDFMTWLTTGQAGTEALTFETDVAAAKDPEFSSYVGVSNALVAVLNNYFRDDYTKVQEKAEKIADKRLSELVSAAENEGVLPEDITTSTMWSGHEQDYIDWTFYVIACDSVKNMQTSGQSFRAKAMLESTKDLLAANELWEIGVSTKVATGTRTEVWEEKKEIGKEPVLDDDGKPKIVDGKPVMKINYEIIKHETEYPTRTITVTYFAYPKSEAKDYIINYYGISDETKNALDLSDKTIVEENVQQMRQLYSSAIGNLIASGQVKDWIEKFYSEHTDLVFNGPSAVSGPIPDWRNHITSHWHETDIPEHASGHNGTDISSPSGTPLTLPSQAVVVAVTNAYPNVVDYSHPRGNLIVLYYGEQNGVAGNGIFVLYQHLADVSVSVGDVLPAGTTVAHSGTSGRSTGPHWHVETYVGLTQLDAEVFLQ